MRSPPRDRGRAEQLVAPCQRDPAADDDPLRVEDVDDGDGGGGERAACVAPRSAVRQDRRPRRPRRRAAPRGEAAPVGLRCVPARARSRPASSASRAVRAMPEPDDIRSRWPRPPQEHSRPFMSTVRWPSSPAAPSGPLMRRPSEMTAPPIPVETVMYTMSVRPRPAPKACSARIATWVSRSRAHGRPSASPMRGPRARPQKSRGRLGGSTRIRAQDRAGRAPRSRSRWAARHCRGTRHEPGTLLRRLVARAITASAPASMAVRLCCRPWTVPGRRSRPCAGGCRPGPGRGPGRAGRELDWWRSRAASRSAKVPGDRHPHAPHRAFR